MFSTAAVCELADLVGSGTAGQTRTASKNFPNGQPAKKTEVPKRSKQQPAHRQFEELGSDKSGIGPFCVFIKWLDIQHVALGRQEAGCGTTKIVRADLCSDAVYSSTWSV